MRSVIAIFFVTLASTASASTPPPPPEYVMSAAEIITSPHQDIASLRKIFANDLVAEKAGKAICTGQSSWLKYAKDHAQARSIIGYSGGWSDKAGDLMVVDSYDSVDRAGLPSTAIADARPATRSILYRFGSDEKIHHIYIQEIKGIWIK